MALWKWKLKKKFFLRFAFNTDSVHRSLMLQFVLVLYFILWQHLCQSSLFNKAAMKMLLQNSANNWNKMERQLVMGYQSLSKVSYYNKTIVL